MSVARHDLFVDMGGMQLRVQVGARLGRPSYPRRPGVADRVRSRAGALSDLELFRPEAVLAAVPSLWAYCAGEWLTLRAPTADSNRSRFPVDPRWQAVHSASLAHAGTELRFIRDRKRAASLASLMPALVGYLVAFAALMGTTDFTSTIEALRVSVANDEIVRRMTFAERVLHRRAERGFR